MRDSQKTNIYISPAGTVMYVALTPKTFFHGIELFFTPRQVLMR